MAVHNTYGYNKSTLAERQAESSEIEMDVSTCIINAVGVCLFHISLVETTKMASATLTLDLEKVLQMPNVVEAGNFDIPQKL